MNTATKLQYPEKRAADTLVRWAISLLFVGLGVAFSVATFLGYRVQLRGGAELPLWAHILVGAALGATGVVIVLERTHSEIDLDRGIVTGWDEETNLAGMATRPLSGFDMVRVDRPDPEYEPDTYVVRLIGQSPGICLEWFSSLEDALQCGRQTAAALGLPFQTFVEDPTR